MIKLSPINWLLSLCAGVMLTSCGIHYTIKGQVVDALTRQPVEGAVVAINWQRYKLLSPPGYGPERVKYGTTDAVTDAKGYFTITKYITGEFNMGVYKAGYICWNNETIFNPDGNTYKETYLPRKKIVLGDGMVIELEPIKSDNFPVAKHAQFVNRIGLQLHGKFTDVTIGERTIERNEIEKRKKSQ